VAISSNDPRLQPGVQVILLEEQDPDGDCMTGRVVSVDHLAEMAVVETRYGRDTVPLDDMEIDPNPDQSDVPSDINDPRVAVGRDVIISRSPGEREEGVIEEIDHTRDEVSVRAVSGETITVGIEDIRILHP
jgi:transcription antitermination factor NusG